MPSSRTDIRQKTGDWVPYSKQLGGLAVAPHVRTSAQRPFGKASFTAHFVGADGVTPISPWHDLELYPTGVAAGSVNFVCEIPRGATAKLEVQKKVPQNPIMQDTKKGALRYYTYGPTFFNYGMLSRYPDTISGYNPPSHPGELIDACHIWQACCHAHGRILQDAGSTGLLATTIRWM